MIDNLSNAFLMSAQIARSAKAVSCRRVKGCNDAVTHRAWSAIIDAQLETGACRLMECQQQRLTAPRTRWSQLIQYLRFVRQACRCASLRESISAKIAFTRSCRVASRFLLSSHRRPQANCLRSFLA